MARRRRRVGRRPQVPRRFQRRCYSCSGTGVEDYTTMAPCERCYGTGWQVMARWEVWARDKRYLGMDHPAADRHGNEKFERFAAEIPPELAALLDQVTRPLWGVNVGSWSRAAVVRFALWELLEKYAPEEPDVVATAVDAPGDLPQAAGS